MMHGSLQCACDGRAYHDHRNRNLFVTLPLAFGGLKVTP
jgi:hypothetical protein